MTWRDDVKEDFLRSKDKPERTAPEGECGDIEQSRKFRHVICQLSKGLRALVTQVGKHKEES